MGSCLLILAIILSFAFGPWAVIGWGIVILFALAASNKK